MKKDLLGIFWSFLSKSPTLGALLTMKKINFSIIFVSSFKYVNVLYSITYQKLEAAKIIYASF